MHIRGDLPDFNNLDICYQGYDFELYSTGFTKWI